MLAFFFCLSLSLLIRRPGLAPFALAALLLETLPFLINFGVLVFLVILILRLGGPSCFDGVALEPGVQKHHSVVHDFQVLGQQLGVVLEFLDKAADLIGLNFNYKGLRPHHVLGGDQQLTTKANHGELTRLLSG